MRLIWVILLSSPLCAQTFTMNKAVANSYNNVAITTPASLSTLTLLTGITFTVDKTMTLNCTGCGTYNLDNFSTGTTTNSVTFNNGGSGAASGTAFNGGTAYTNSYNTLGAAPLASPAFTGTPTAPTQSVSTNNTDIATTAAVTTALASYAPLASPALTGTPTAPTQAVSTNNTDIATTAAVTTALASYAPLASPTFTGTPAAPTASSGTNTTQIATTAFAQASGEVVIGSTGNWPFFSASKVVAQAIAVNSMHFKSLIVTNADGGTCTTAPTFNIFDTGSNTGTAVTGSNTQQAFGTASGTSGNESLAVAAGDLYGVYMSNQGSSCTGGVFSVYAVLTHP